MGDDIIAYCDYLACRAEFENDNIIWGDDWSEVDEDEKCPKIPIFKKYTDEELMEEIPY